MTGWREGEVVSVILRHGATKRDGPALSYSRKVRNHKEGEANWGKDRNPFNWNLVVAFWSGQSPQNSTAWESTLMHTQPCLVIFMKVWTYKLPRSSTEPSHGPWHLPDTMGKEGLFVSRHTARLGDRQYLALTRRTATWSLSVRVCVRVCGVHSWRVEWLIHQIFKMQRYDHSNTGD